MTPVIGLESEESFHTCMMTARVFFLESQQFAVSAGRYLIQLRGFQSMLFYFCPVKCTKLGAIEVYVQYLYKRKINLSFSPLYAISDNEQKSEPVSGSERGRGSVATKKNPLFLSPQNRKGGSSSFHFYPLHPSPQPPHSCWSQARGIEGCCPKSRPETSRYDSGDVVASSSKKLCVLTRPLLCATLLASCVPRQDGEGEGNKLPPFLGRRGVGISD